MLILRHRLVRGQLLKPPFVVVVQPRLVIVDKHRRRDVHRINQHQTLLYTTLTQTPLHVRCDVLKCPPCGHLIP
ncbi:hypothetical protein MBAV_006006 [Candidatus Magnetobacterium bavaricum]|uniref:Uncharacterized protein n=1 Tax=Candidatus Magnetobacterium bavaricum TaxID=29290 RepID=A0A0F3GJ10_9BACT|nr:hypothetical protein MBAV_006006 [Candidatus Magnetobacterium bavaricum]